MRPDWVSNTTILLVVEVVLALFVVADIIYRERQGKDVGPGKYLVYAWCANCIMFSVSAILCLNADVCIVSRASINVWSSLVDLQGLISLLIYMRLFVT